MVESNNNFHAVNCTPIVCLGGTFKTSQFVGHAVFSDVVPTRSARSQSQVRRHTE